ncbi:MAG: PAS domain-containing protein [Terriglobales bacterium]
MTHFSHFANLRRVMDENNTMHMENPIHMREVEPYVKDRFFDLSIDMLCIAHFSGYFVKLNPAWERTLGFTREELRSKPMFDFVHPEDRERTLAQNKVVRSGGQALCFENRYRCKDGSYRWFRWNASADLNHQLIYSVARDITESKRAEEEREQLLQQLQSALSEVRELREILPICMYCKNIRNDNNYWQTVETYISHHTRTKFSHGVCPKCITKLFE